MWTTERRPRNLYGKANFDTGDDSNHIVDANDAFLKLVGYSAYDLRENRIDLGVLTPVEFTGRVKDAIRELLDSGSVKPFEKQCCRGDGSKISVLIGMALLNREPLKYICLALDITERKLMEDALSRIRDELEIRVRERTAELGKANEELRLIPGKLIAAQENERKRIAGELHDSIGQTLAALKFHVEHISITLKSGNTELALDLVDRIVPVLQRSINETRAIYMGLRPRMLEDMGIVVTLRWFCREMQNLYPNMHFEPEIDIEEDDVPEPFKIAIFRIAQEALNNAAKYSKAKWVDLSLTQKDGVIRLVIADEGIGMDLDYIIQSSTAKSLGLTGMKERVELTGGKFSMKSVPNEGTSVEAVWKLS
jgi:PAS domain S-box-containing protein